MAVGAIALERKDIRLTRGKYEKLGIKQIGDVPLHLDHILTAGLLTLGVPVGGNAILKVR